MHVYYYCSLVDQIKLLFKKNILPVKRYYCTDSNYITDIKDGLLYKDLLRKTKPEKDVEVYTFMINIDGISCCDKSTLAIWPVYLAINEIDIGSRFHIDNIILAGICVGLTKPLIDEFFIPIKKELLNLSLGICLDDKL